MMTPHKNMLYFIYQLHNFAVANYSPLPRTTGKKRHLETHQPKCIFLKRVYTFTTGNIFKWPCESQDKPTTF